MSVNWGALLIVCVVALAVGVVIVSLVSFALVGLSARERAAVGGPHDGAPTLSAGAGTGIAAACLLAVAAIVIYGLYIIIA